MSIKEILERARANAPKISVAPKVSEELPKEEEKKDGEKSKQMVS